MIDLVSSAFWIVVASAAVLLTPIDHPALRRLAFATVNVAFLWLLLHRNLPAVLLATVFAWLLLVAVGRGGARRWAAILALLAAIVLFILHKLPGLSRELRVTEVNPLLVSIGYAFVFLRFLDVLRAIWERRYPPPGLIQLFNYLMPFHMLAAGPIQAWDDYAASDPLVPRPLTAGEALRATERIVHGLFKKFVLAFFLVEVLSTHMRAGGWYRLLEMNAFYIWLYLDFSAYSDIALGVGQMLGVATPRNFNRPYLARNITDFWDRWHISLSQWIRRNLFLPMHLSLLRRWGGRNPLVAASIAIFVAFVLCGAWHGLTVPFLLWGLINAVGLVVCNLYREGLKRRLGGKGVKRYLASPWIRGVSTVVTFEFVAFSLIAIAEHGGSPW